MQRHLIALFLLGFAATLAGCRSAGDRIFIGPDDCVLAKRREGAEVTTWRLETLADTRLFVAREFDRERAVLGLDAKEISKEDAERRGVKPYSGMLVTRVAPDSPAAVAGVLVHDIVLAMDGADVVYREQFDGAAAKLAPGGKLALRLLRGQQETNVEVVLGRVTARASEERRIDLDIPPTPVRAYAGATLRGIPADVCKAIYGAPRNAIVVTDVEVGSPAWVAGVRSADVIDQVDGEPAPDVRALSERIAALGVAGGSMRWTVRRGEGPQHEALVPLHDYQRGTAIRVPLLFCLDDGTFDDSWSLGPWGLLMNDQSRYVADKSTRAPRTRSIFRAVLGLLRVETSPQATEVRLLWFVQFSV